MREYGKVSPRFWTGETGKKIRAMGCDAQLIALYLLTCPNATMTGLYYLPMPTLVHETGIPFEGASKALASLSEGGFAFYDDASEVVFVPEMARHQIGETLTATDKRVKGVVRELESFSKSRFVLEFYEKYKEAFNLPRQGPWKGLARGLEGPPKPRAGAGARTGAGDTPDKPGLTLLPDEGTDQPKAKRWSIGAMLSVFRDHGGGQFHVDPYDAGLNKPFNAVIGSLADAGVTLVDVEVAARWVASGGAKWISNGGGVGLTWLCKAGNIADLIARAVAAQGTRGAA
jgi:hypothetical protein